MNVNIGRFLSILALVLTVSSSACGQRLTEEDKQKIAELKSQLESTKQSVEDAKAEDSKYSGGLVKALIAVRLQILQQNQVLIEQRINAIESGARISVVE